MEILNVPGKLFVFGKKERNYKKSWLINNYFLITLKILDASGVTISTK
jgi:hypothetical protein